MYNTIRHTAQHTAYHQKTRGESILSRAPGKSGLTLPEHLCQQNPSMPGSPGNIDNTLTILAEEGD